MCPNCQASIMSFEGGQMVANGLRKRQPASTLSQLLYGGLRLRIRGRHISVCSGELLNRTRIRRIRRIIAFESPQRQFLSLPTSLRTKECISSSRSDEEKIRATRKDVGNDKNCRWRDSKHKAKWTKSSFRGYPRQSAVSASSAFY